MKKILQPKKVFKPVGLYSQGIKLEKVRSLIFIAGQVARDSKGNLVGKGDIKIQTRQVIENIKEVLAQGGATLNDVVKMTMFVTNMADRYKIAQVRKHYWKKDYPTNTLVEVKGLADSEYLIEIEAIAIL